MKRLMDLSVLFVPVCLAAACTGQLDATDAPDPGLTQEPALYQLNDKGVRQRTGWYNHRPWALDAGEAPAEDAGVPTDPTPEPTADAGTEPTPTPTADAGAEPTPDPTPDAGTPAPTPTGDLASLGPLPAEMAGLQWPAAPVTTRTVRVTTAADASAAASTPGTRVEINGAVGGGVRVSADDVEIVADAATHLDQLTISRGVHRVRVSGGHWSGVLLSMPAVFYPSTEYRSEWMVEDVLVQDTVIDSPNMAFEIRGRRIALLRNDVTAIRYSVWCGDTGPMQSEDLILHQNSFDSSGPEATVRLVQVLRTATIDNTFHNPNKHNYRIHGISDLNYAADNLLLGSGVMLGRMAGDTLGRVWFDNNTFYHYTPDLFNPDHAIAALHAHDNVAYTDVWSSWPGGSEAGWDIAANAVMPYVAPPSP